MKSLKTMFASLFFGASLTILGGTTAQAERMLVIIEDPADAPFSLLLAGVGNAVAEDLGIEVEYKYMDGNPVESVRVVDEAYKSATPPDYVIFANFKRIAEPILKVTEAANGKALIYDTGLAEDEVAKIGQPGEKYKSFLGAYLPDDHAAGYNSGVELIAAAHAAGKVNADGKVEVLAIGGPPAHFASDSRIAGLMQAATDKNAVIVQTINVNWDQADANKRTAAILGRYPNLSGLWGASDYLAFGAGEAAVAGGKKLSQDVFIAGVALSPEALHMIEAGEMVSSVGGNFMDVGRAMIIAHDHANGIPLPENFQTPMTGLSKEDSKVFAEKFGKNDYSAVDFKKFSKVHNKDLQDYKFTVEDLLKSAM